MAASVCTGGPLIGSERRLGADRTFSSAGMIPMPAKSAPRPTGYRRPVATHELELPTGGRTVDECLPSGRLNPLARGWSRHPVLRANLRGPWGRVKRWEYWSVIGGGRTVAITYADVDYLGIAGLWCC